MDILARLDRLRAEIDVLEHPFYQRWSAGELSAHELDRYAGEYRHAVVALARASALAAECAAAGGEDAAAGLAAHAREEHAHVALWEQFECAAREATARADGHGESASELAGTRSCAEAWCAGTDLLEHLAVLYSIEAGQPQISAAKLAGLAEHYGFSEEGPASEYFRLHEHRDVEHAREAGELIERLMAELEDPEEQAQRMIARARAALRGNWLLLDSVEGARLAAAAA